MRQARDKVRSLSAHQSTAERIHFGSRKLPPFAAVRACEAWRRPDGALEAKSDNGPDADADPPERPRAPTERHLPRLDAVRHLTLCVAAQ